MYLKGPSWQVVNKFVKQSLGIPIRGLRVQIQLMPTCGMTAFPDMTLATEKDRTPNLAH